MRVVVRVPKHCPICNASSNDAEFVGEFCASCAGNRLSKRTIHGVSIERCRRCSRIRIGKEFLKPDLGSMQKAISSSFKGHPIKLISIEDDSATIEIMHDENAKTAVEKRINMSFEPILCERCRKKAGSYYEAVFQLRGDAERIRRLISKLTLYLERRSAFVTRLENKDSGIDVYISDKKLAVAFISKGHLEAKASYTLYGLRNGKKIYRHTYAIRL